MEKNKIIIGVLIAIIIALLVVGAVLIMPNFNKIDTKLAFEGNSTITEGDSIKIKLTDDNGTSLANQAVNITVTDENRSSDYHSVVTDENGIGTLNLDKTAGNYSITVVYGGDENHAGCNATKKITIKKEVKQAQTTSSSSSSSNYDSGAFYSPQSNGMVYTGDTHKGPDGHTWVHLGNNQWEKID